MKMPISIKLGLIAALVFQLLVLTGMYALAALPLWTGSEIRLKTIPVDPRSLFRGNYARLRYDISQVEADLLPGSEDLRNGEVVYTALRPGKDDIYEFAGISLTPPDSGAYLRGRIANHQYVKKRTYLRIKYGIEAFFAPKEKALALEKALRQTGVAVLVVSAGGKARLKDVIAAK